MPLPCTHLSPASSTDHFELSIMIGTRSDLRLGGDQPEETRHARLGVEHPLVHVDVDDVGAAAHLIEGDVGGLRVVRPSLMRRAKRRDPVTLVRSPIIVKLLSGRTGEPLEAAELGDPWPSPSATSGRQSGRRPSPAELGDPPAPRRPAADAAATSATASATARMCSGVVPQHPPSEVDEAAASRTRGAGSAGLFRMLVVLAERVRQTGVRIAAHATCRSIAGPARPGTAASPGRPRAQLMTDRERLVRAPPTVPERIDASGPTACGRSGR